MICAEVTRSDSNRSDASQRPRVSFNRDVHVKRIAVPRENPRTLGAVNSLNNGGDTVLTSPIRKQRVQGSKKELAEEAAKVLDQADRVGCVASNQGRIPDKFYTLPNRKRSSKDVPKSDDYSSQSLDRRSSQKRRASLELRQPPKKPPRTFAASRSSGGGSTAKPSIFDIFGKRAAPQQPKKSNLRRSVSDATALRRGPVDGTRATRKRADSDDEGSLRRGGVKKQLSPIIEVTQREDYFSTDDNKENITNNSDKFGENKRCQSVTEQLKDYIEEVDEELFKETGIRITSTPRSASPQPKPIIIDLDKAEDASSGAPKRHKLKKNFELGKKLIKSLAQRKTKSPPPPASRVPDKKNGVRNDVKTIRNDTPPLVKLSKPTDDKKPTGLVAPTIQSKPEPESPTTMMIHSSQKPAEKPPLTKGKTVNSMVKRLSSDSCASPPPHTRTNVLIMPNVSVQHNNNQPFSYTRGISPDKYRSHEDLPRDTSPLTPPNTTATKPVIYAQVVCAANGLVNEKQTIHTTYRPTTHHQQQSDSDEGLGGEADSSGFNRKATSTRFGDVDRLSYQSDADKLLDEIDKYKAESPIMPKYRPTGTAAHFGAATTMERGRADGMDAAKRRESFAEADDAIGRFATGARGGARVDLAARRDLLESRTVNRRIGDKTTPSPEYYPTSRRNGAFGERHVESRPTKFDHTPSPITRTDLKYDDDDPQISDYRSSPENRHPHNTHQHHHHPRHRFESSQHQNGVTTTGRNQRYQKPIDTAISSTLLKDRNLYRSTPEIRTGGRRHPDDDAFHDSLPRKDKLSPDGGAAGGGRRFRSERFLDRDETNDRRTTDRFVDSGIENDFIRRDSGENYRDKRPNQNHPDFYNESEDEGFASSLLIASEKHNAGNGGGGGGGGGGATTLRKSRKSDYYDSDVLVDPSRDGRNDRYAPRERSVDDGSHYDPRLDKIEIEDETRRRRPTVEKKPPKPEKRSGLDKVRSLFVRDKNRKDKTGATQKTNHKTKSLMYSKRTDDSIPDYRNRRRLSTPSPSRDPPPKKAESTHGSWFKSLDRLAKRKTDKRSKSGHVSSTEEEVTNNSPTKLSASTNNLRFFGDTDQESNGDSLRGVPPALTTPRRKPSSGLRSQSTRDLHNIAEETRHASNGRKAESHHKSLTNISESERCVRDVKGSRTSLKPPTSPVVGRFVSQNTLRSRNDDRRRPKRPDMSSVESSTEGDSSQQSQRSIVYLHAATVGDIPGPGYLRSGRTPSREDLTSNGSSFAQPQVKTLSRSFSVLAPWKPRHQRDALDIDYTQYNKGKYEQRTARRRTDSTLKRKAAHQQQSKELLDSRGSTSTLYRKKDKLPRENVRYVKDRGEDGGRKMTTKSHSVESIARKSRDDVSRSVSMPRDTDKTAGWFRKSKNASSNRRL